MEATGVSRRQQPVHPAPPLSGEAASPDHAASEHSVCGGHSDRARGSPLLPPAPGGTGDPRAFRRGLLLVAWLSLAALALVSGSYFRPSLAFLYGIQGGATILRQQQTPPSLDGHVDTSNAAVAAPSWNSERSDANHHVDTSNAVVAAPSSTSERSDAGLHNEIVAPPPDSAAGKIKLSEAELQNGAAAAAAAGAPPLAAAGSGSEGANAPPSPGGDARDKLLGGLLAAGFDEESCLSRYQSASYYRRRKSPYEPSPFLMKCLRRYEALHERCGPYTDAYNMSLLQLVKASRGGATRPLCKFLVWAPENGLGNRMVSLASAFLYALLADRVLLILRSKDLGTLFCEPFPRSSWLLPPDFPLKVSPAFNRKHPQSYGNMLRTAFGAAAASTPLPGTPPSFVYAHLSHDYDGNDKRFFCEADQRLLEKIPWMVLRSDQYFVPALFLVPAFRGRLGRMFPEKEAVFHHLGKYLFHPSNAVWGLITDYYKAHLAGADERLGIQIRLLFRKDPPFELVVRQILNCTWTQKLLPEPDPLRRQPVTANGTWSSSSKAVLLTSLQSGFLGRLEGVYRGGRRAGGVSFHQPSHEGRQQTGREEHDAKALAEMYLLSMGDELVTSAWSTFGYVAQGLGGLIPWILQGPVHTRVPEPACVRDASTEPCFHYPPNYDCTTGGYADTRKMLLPALISTGKCRDRKGGLKLVARLRKIGNHRSIDSATTS